MRFVGEGGSRTKERGLERSSRDRGDDRVDDGSLVLEGRRLRARRSLGWNQAVLDERRERLSEGRRLGRSCDTRREGREEGERCFRFRSSYACFLRLGGT